MLKLVVANYKMNGSKQFFASAFKQINKLKVKDTEIVLCPPFVYLHLFKKKKNNISLGSQDVCGELSKKATGQISSAILKDCNVEYSIIGHSEQRQIGLTNQQVADKVNMAVKSKILPIVCVGESSKRSSLNLLKEQVESSVKKSELSEIIFAYEPVWAIGTGEVPTNKRINEAVDMIKDICVNLKVNAKVLYGGSVNAKNYKDLLKTNVDGFLVGGASLNIDEFCEIVKGVENE